MEKVSDQTHYYQVYPSRSEYDIMLWHNIKADNTESINVYAAKCMLVVNKYREFFEPSLIFSGITKDLVLSSSGNMIEIWDKNSYESIINNDEVDFAKLAEDVMGSKNIEDDSVS